ncbi:MAG: site-specific integrase [Stenomitos rutilans HA7619-LM2]|jgi:integrase|nr:site-specific integrase [Stenomitos rutilans HA7619-LM2]
MQKIRLQNRNGRIGIQFTANGQRCSLYGLGNWDSHSDKAKAEALVRQIEADILERTFDPTLERYRQGLSKAVNKLGTPVEMFAKWMGTVKPNDGNFKVHYEPVLQALIASGSRSYSDKGFNLYWSHLSPRTYNDRVGYLRRFGKWLVDENYLPHNPYRNLKNRPVERVKIKPFTPDEVTLILATLYAKSLMIGSFYSFLFLTGCRPSEAIGLLKSKVDTEQGIVTIDCALARSEDGSSAAANRRMKETKTGDVRVLPLSKQLSLCIVSALGWQQNNQVNSELVFCNQKGEALDDRNLLNRYWKPCLESLNIPYRKPYITRHTAASTVIENGGTLADAAKLLGHSDLRMVSTVYGHAIKEIQLPSYKSEGEVLG